MNEEAYAKLAEQAIEAAERRSRGDSIESFYRGLLTMIQTVKDRMDCAEADGVDLTEL